MKDPHLEGSDQYTRYTHGKAADSAGAVSTTPLLLVAAVEDISPQRVQHLRMRECEQGWLRLVQANNTKTCSFFTVPSWAA